MRSLKTLFTNHMDAWGVALIIAALALGVHDALSLRTIPFLLAVAGSYWLGFAFNDYTDAPFDALDEEKGRSNFFVANPVPGRWISIGFAAMGFVFVVGAFVLYGLRGILIVAMSLAVIWAYSARPLRLKSRPGLDLLTHTFFVETYPYIITIVLLGVAWTRLDAILIAIFLVGSLSAQLEQQLFDFELDAKTEPNFTTWLGPKRTMRLLRATTVILAAISIVFALDGTIPLYLLPFGLIAAPLLAHRFLRAPGRRRPRFLTFGTLAAGLAYTGLILAQ
jgi:4-hydroxybenzoate polyprenyltransferase